MPTPSPKAPTPVEYRALVGLNYGPTDKRVEAEDIVTDLPPESIGWLVDQGLIRAVADEDPIDEDNPLLADGDDPNVVAVDTGENPVEED